jgi:hypothetical protein
MKYNISIMEIKVSAVVKRGRKWFVGYLDGLEFKVNKEVKNLRDVKEVTDYKTLKSYLRLKNKSDDLGPLILEKIKADTVYILDKPVYPSIEEFENYWWKELNELCLGCKGECKQSSKVTVEVCKLYESKS